MAGLTEQGFTAKRAVDVFDDMRADITELLDERGLPSDVDFGADTIAGLLTAALAAQIGELWSAALAVYGATDPDSASGVLLDHIGAISGIPRLQATTGTVTLTVVTTTPIPAGSIVEGGLNPDGTPARWVTTEPIAASGDVEAVAAVEGAATAGAGEITTIVTPVSGWNSVTNAAAVTASTTAGRDTESDAAYRVRRAATSAQAGGRSVASLRGRLLAIAGVDSAVVLENRDTSSSVVAGKTLPANSINVVVAPSTMTESVKLAVGIAIFAWGPAGIANFGSDETVTLRSTLGAFADTSVDFDYATDVSVDAAATITLDDGFELADVQAQVEEAISGYINSLPIGGDVLLLDVYAAIATVDGVRGVTALTLNAGPIDIVIDIIERAVVGTLTVS